MLELSEYIFARHYYYEIINRHNGLKHGVVNWSHDDGSIALLQYWHNVLKHGVVILYHEDGSIAQLEQWHNGVMKHGVVIWYHDDGSIAQLEQWCYGKKIEIQNLY